jgi:hypothetical protein
MSFHVSNSTHLTPHNFCVSAIAALPMTVIQCQYSPQQKRLSSEEAQPMFGEAEIRLWPVLRYRPLGGTPKNSRGRWDRNRTCNLRFWRKRHFVFLRRIPSLQLCEARFQALSRPRPSEHVFVFCCQNCCQFHSR